MAPPSLWRGDPSVWTAGSNDYCTVPTAGDAWAGFYRSTNGGSNWTDSLLPGYHGDASAQGTSSPLAAMVAGGALAAGDPMMSWDGRGDLFYMGNNFNRGVENGVSGRFKDNTGDIWVATYGPSNAADHSTDGSKYLRTVILAANTFGLGSFNDKTDLVADPVSGNVYAAWSDFHGNGCNEIFFSRSADHGATFSTPVKISSGICGNQGPSIVIGPSGQVDVAWEGNTGGALSRTPGAVTGAAFAASDDFGKTFDNVHGTLVMAFQAAQPSGQGQIEFAVSTDGGATWSTPALLAPSASGHQFYVWLTASAGRVSAIWYDSRGDSAYSATRAPCNSASGQTSACLNVRYAESADGGKTFGPSIQVSNAPTNPNYEQFGGRLVPFFGDYITVAAQGDTIGAVWTDQRNTVGAADTAGDNDGADVAGDPEAGGTCRSSLTTCFDTTGGLDQNIYSAAITP